MPLKRFEKRDRPTREHTISSLVSKKPRLDQIPAASLNADDPQQMRKMKMKILKRRVMMTTLQLFLQSWKKLRKS